MPYEGTCRRSAHQSYNANFILTIKTPLIFHNNRVNKHHYLMVESGKLRQDIDVVPNGMEKYTALMDGKKIYWQWILYKFGLRNFS